MPTEYKLQLTTSRVSAELSLAAGDIYICGECEAQQMLADGLAILVSSTKGSTLLGQEACLNTATKTDSAQSVTDSTLLGQEQKKPAKTATTKKHSRACKKGK